MKIFIKTFVFFQNIFFSNIWFHIYNDNFNGFSPGEFQILDRIDDDFNAINRVFPLTLQGEPVSIVAARDSNIEVDQTLLVFINDILLI